MDIPVYLIAGFLDGGKTDFINGILKDGFAREEKTLLLCCEEGEEEYNKNALDNITVVTVEDEEKLTCSFLKECEKKYKPRQVLIEYNGMLVGFLSTDEQKLRLLRSMGASRGQVLRKLVLPANFPALFNTLRVNVGLSWVGVIMDNPSAAQ